MDHLSLVELNKLIQDTLKKHLEPSYWVVAEIGDLSVNQKGHCYLELIENQDNVVVAKSRATIWSYTYRNLSAWFEKMAGTPLSEGMKILANVKITHHEVFGLSLNIQDIDATYTIGDRQKQRQAVINRLIADGILTINKELQLPLVPQNIAVISSPTAAGYGDFIQHIQNNAYGYGFNTILFDAVMQGSQAANSIIAALHRIIKNDAFDLVVLIRGGGSQLDLECFDDYDLCSHLAQFPLPIITGIGHERDETIADVVAHTKLKTPTAVAEFIVQGIVAYETEVDTYAAGISKTAMFLLQKAQLLLQNIVSSTRLVAQRQIVSYQYNLASEINRFKHNAVNSLDSNRNILEKIELKHQSLNPKKILARGYSISFINDTNIINKKAHKGEILSTYTKNQIIESEIKSIKKNDKI